MNKIHIKLLIGAVVFLIVVIVMCFIGSINFAPSKKEQEKLTRICKWEMEYTEENKLLKGEVVYSEPEEPEPVQGIYYTYDDYGNRIEREIVDYVYDEGHEKSFYEYDDGKIMSKSSEGGYEVEFSYTEDYVSAKGMNNLASELEYRYKFTSDEIIQAIEIYQEDALENTRAEYRYDKSGRIKELVLNFWKDDTTYTYEYDMLGRYKDIKCKIGSAYNKANLTAKFVYNGLSKNSVAYLYNEDVLVGKYIYEHDKQGNLVGVSIYADTDNYYAWGTTDQRLEFNYPSGEIHDNFYEMW